MNKYIQCQFSNYQLSGPSRDQHFSSVNTQFSQTIFFKPLCFTEHGVGLIHRVPQGVKVNAKEYIKILIEGLLPSLELFPNTHWAIFMQDNAPCHKTKAVSHWFTEMNINVLENWPPQSPD